MRRTSVPLRLALASLVLAGLAAPRPARAQVLSGNAVFNAIQPCRLFDTRGIGKLAPGVHRTFNAVGVMTAGSLASQGGNPSGCPIPGFSGAGPQVQAIVINLAVITPGGTGVLQAWGSDQPEPTASVLNFTAAETVLANEVVLPVRQDMQGADITLSSNVTTDVLGDVVGYFASMDHGSNAAVAGGLDNLTTGQENTAVGGALAQITTSSYNTGVGSSEFFNMTASGSDANTAVGAEAFYSMTGGDHNIGLGYRAGYYTETGSYNIYIGNTGSSGVASESGTIRIGDPMHQSSTYIAGIYNGNAVGGSEVFVTSAGSLGTLSSSLRYKEDVADMGGASAGLMQLRPVVFHYRAPYDDDRHELQYGLIAEEVARIYPGLVQNDATGRPQSVRYHFLAPMLLNEVQKQRHDFADQAATIAAQARDIARQQTALAALSDQVDALRRQLEQLATGQQPRAAEPRPAP